MLGSIQYLLLTYIQLTSAEGWAIGSASEIGSMHMFSAALSASWVPQGLPPNQSLGHPIPFCPFRGCPGPRF